MSETETGYQERHEATVAALTDARVELSRLRGVVEAVQALADEWADLFPASPSDASIVGCGHRLRAALAPVSSSGEAALPAGGRAEVAALRTAVETLVLDLNADADYRVPKRYLGDRLRAALAASVGPSGEAESGEPNGDDHERGLYGKYRVERIVDPTGKHDDCRYFVLDPQHDPNALRALRTYADACEDEYPALAADLREWAGPAPVSSGGQADGEGRCEHGIPLPDPTRAAERVLAHVSATGDGLLANVDGAPLYGRDLESVAKAALAARPVLSREALAEAWDKGRRMGASRAMRHMSDEPGLPLASELDNPYLAGGEQA